MSPSSLRGSISLTTGLLYYRPNHPLVALNVSLFPERQHFPDQWSPLLYLFPSRPIMSPSSLRGSISLTTCLLYYNYPPSRPIMSLSSLRSSIFLTTGLLYYNHPLISPSIMSPSSLRGSISLTTGLLCYICSLVALNVSFFPERQHFPDQWSPLL